jgi:beta-lactamase superfamily II metal-dependent hydrolase
MSRKKYKYYFMASGLIAAMFAYFIFSLPDGKLHVFFLDVGQGDAALVRTPSGGFILIDGGPDAVLRAYA